MNISRRNALALGGIGFTLAACDGGNPFGFLGGSRPESLGQWPDHGLSPMIDPETLPTYKGKFKPQFIALVHLGFLPNWAMTINYACLTVGQGHGPVERLRRAVRVLREKIGATGVRKFRELQRENPDNFKDMYFFKNHGCYDFDDLSNFRFKSQAEIFFFFDHPAISFEASPLMRATRLTSTGAECAENDSFLGAGFVEETHLGDLKYRGKLLRLRNYALRPDADQEQARANYSLNIHMTLKDPNGGHPVPMTFDPDTGNGLGYEP